MQYWYVLFLLKKKLKLLFGKMNFNGRGHLKIIKRANEKKSPDFELTCHRRHLLREVLNYLPMANNKLLK